MAEQFLLTRLELASKKITANNLILQLKYKQELLDAFTTFTQAVVAYSKAKGEPLVEIPADITTPKGTVTVWEQVDHTNLPPALIEPFYIIKNKLALVADIEQIPVDEYLEGHQIQHVGHSDIVKFLEYSHIFSWGLQIRKHYYITVIGSPEGASVPADRTKREPDTFLEDAIQNLAEEIYELERKLV
jgi:hypothetical protein